MFISYVDDFVFSNELLYLDCVVFGVMVGLCMISVIV